MIYPRPEDFPKPKIADFYESAITRRERTRLVLDGIITGDAIGHPYEGLFEMPFLLNPDTADLVTDKCGTRPTRIRSEQ